MTLGAVRIAALAGLLSAGMAAAAHAQSDDDFSMHPYLSVAGSWGIEQFDDDGVRVDDGVGLDTRIGFRVLPYLSAEAQWEYFPGFDTSLGDVRVHTLTGNVKAFLVNENTGPFEPYAVGGVGQLFSDLRGDGEDGLVVRFGGGMNMKFSDHVGFVVEGTYVMPFASVRDMEYVSVVWGFQLDF